MAFIELKDVSYKYPYTKNFALQNVTCSFEKGKFYGVIGENGGGKTTLCNVIRGLIPHFYLGKLTGEVLVEGWISANGTQQICLPESDMSSRILLPKSQASSPPSSRK